jgi:cobalt/nickel transport system ATP-binding protein
MGDSNHSHVEIEALSFSYPDGRSALANVSIDIAPGEKVGLVGHNGAGKSTLLLHLIGILKGRGTIRVDGIEVNVDNLRQVRSKVGLVFQDPNDQLFSPTVFDDVAFGPLNMGLSDAEVKLRTESALEQVSMGDFAERMPHHLSLGEKKKASIATVLSMQPVILALDEPAAGLDPKGRRDLVSLLCSLPQTMLLASHDLDLISQVCNRAIVLRSGRVVADLQADQLPERETLLYQQ